jgi:hypothetical protein
MKIKHIFSKVHFILKKTWFILKFYKYVWIIELYKNENVNEKKVIGINALLLSDYKKTKLTQKKEFKMDF